MNDISQPMSPDKMDFVNSECVVCMDQIEDEAACYSTLCPHLHHMECFVSWLSRNRSCPSCRRRVVKVKMKSGETVPLPRLDPIYEGYFLSDFLPDAQYAAGEGLESEPDNSSDEEFRFPGTVEHMDAQHGTRPQRPRRRIPTIINNAPPPRRSHLMMPPRRFHVDLERLDEQLESELRIGRRNGRIAYSESEDEEEEVPRRQPRRRRAIESSDEDEVQVNAGNQNIADEEEEESATDESETESEETEDGEGTDNSELDDGIIFEDQPSTSSQMVPIVRKKRGTKKTIKRKSSKRKTGKKKSKKTKTIKKKSKRRRPTAEERSEQRHRVTSALPSLSLNGASVEPIDAEDGESLPKRSRVHPRPSQAPPPSNNPTDLLGTILTNQLVTLAPGRHLQQRDGRLEPRESFNRHLERMKKHGPLSRFLGSLDDIHVATHPASSISSSSTPTLSTSSPPATGTSRNDSSSNRLFNDPTRRNQGMNSWISPFSSLLSSNSPNWSSGSPIVGEMNSSREVPLLNPFSTSTPLPRPPSLLTRNGSSQQASSSSIPHCSVRPSTSTSSNERAERQTIKRERARLIRNAANDVLNRPVRNGAITEETRRTIVKRVHDKFFDRLFFDEQRTQDFARKELNTVLGMDEIA